MMDENKSLIWHDWKFATGALLLTTAVFGGIVAYITCQLRNEIRQQIVHRDAEILYPVIAMYMAREDDDGVSSDEAYSDRVLDALLQTSELRGVIGISLFDVDGQFIASIPETILPTALSKGELGDIHACLPISRYHPHAHLNKYFLELPADSHRIQIPLLEVLLPLHGPEAQEIDGAALYLIDAASIESEFSILDRNLVRQALTAFFTGALLLAIIQAAAFRMLRRSNRLLEERGRRLTEANRELTLASKTSAIGAMTSFLIHDIKNPLAGLQEFISGKSASQRDTEWQAAEASAGRIQGLIREVIAVLQDDKYGVNVDCQWREIRDMIDKKIAPVAAERQVKLNIIGETGEFDIDSRTGSLLVMILMNLLRNAVESTPAGKNVAMTDRLSNGHIEITVADEGGGLPDTVRDHLFMPCRSLKKDGAGIGLAIAKQLARQIGAELSLKNTGTQGTEFVVVWGRGSAP